MKIDRTSKERQKRFRARHRAEIAEHMRFLRNNDSYYIAYTKKRNKEYRLTLKGKIAHRLGEHRRRLLKQNGNLSDKITTQYVLDIFSQFNDLCIWCYNNKAEHIDHLIPLSRGGSHTLSNIVPACGSCNVKRYNKMPLEWIWQNA